MDDDRLLVNCFCTSKSPTISPFRKRPKEQIRDPNLPANGRSVPAAVRWFPRHRGGVGHDPLRRGGEHQAAGGQAAGVEERGLRPSVLPAHY